MFPIKHAIWGTCSRHTHEPHSGDVSDLVGFLFCIVHCVRLKSYAYSILFDSCWMLPTWNNHDPLRLDSGEHCRNMTYYTRLSISRWSAKIFHRGLLLTVSLCAFKMANQQIRIFYICFQYLFLGYSLGSYHSVHSEWITFCANSHYLPMLNITGWQHVVELYQSNHQKDYNPSCVQMKMMNIYLGKL